MKKNARFKIVSLSFFTLLALTQPSFAQNCTRAEYGDINLNGVVNLDDILCILSGFSGDHSCASLASQDIYPCSAQTGPIGDGTVDIDDVLSGLKAFSGQSDCVGVCISCTNNQAPTANAGPDRNGQVGVTIVFNGSASTDPNGNSSIDGYWWNFGDGDFTGWLPTPTVSHIYASSGMYVLRLWVRDSCGELSENDLATITINNSGNPCTNNAAPNANAGPNLSGVIGAALNFNGSQSFDPDGSIVSYSWNFGDGTSGSGSNINHIYTTAGVYTATLTVTDNCSVADIDTASVNITNPNQAPNVNAGPNQNITMPTSGSASTNLSGSYTDDGLPFGGPVSTIWSYVSGTTTPSFANPLALNTSVTFPVSGSYLLRLTVNDGALLSSDEVTVTVNPNGCVNNFPPSASAGPDLQGTVGSYVAFNAAGSLDTNGSIQSYSWNFGDGQTGTGIAINHIYPSPGLYSVVLTVTDNCGASGNDTLLVQVATASGGPLDANFRVLRQTGAGIWTPINLSTQSLGIGEQVYLDGSISAGGPSFFVWEPSIGIVNQGNPYFFNFSTPGSYPVLLTVYNLSGSLFDSITKSVFVVQTMASGDGMSFDDEHPESIAIEGNRAFVGRLNAGLTTIDVTNPNQIFERSTISSPAARNIAASNGFVFLCSRTAGLNSYNAANTPNFVGNYASNAQDAVANGKVVYLAAGAEGVKLLNMNNPANPVVLGSLPLPANAQATVIEVVNHIAFVADTVAKVHLIRVGPIDVMNPTPFTPYLIKTIAPGFPVNTLASNGNVLAIAAPGGFRLYDVQYLETPGDGLVFQSNNPEGPLYGRTANKLVITGNSLYACYSSGQSQFPTGIAKFNIINPPQSYLMEFFNAQSLASTTIKDAVIRNNVFYGASGTYSAFTVNLNPQANF